MATAGTSGVSGANDEIAKPKLEAQEGDKTDGIVSKLRIGADVDLRPLSIKNASGDKTDERGVILLLASKTRGMIIKGIYVLSIKRREQRRLYGNSRVRYLNRDPDETLESTQLYISFATATTSVHGRELTPSRYISYASFFVPAHILQEKILSPVVSVAGLEWFLTPVIYGQFRYLVTKMFKLIRPMNKDGSFLDVDRKTSIFANDDDIFSVILDRNSEKWMEVTCDYLDHVDKRHEGLQTEMDEVEWLQYVREVYPNAPKETAGMSAKQIVDEVFNRRKAALDREIFSVFTVGLDRWPGLARGVYVLPELGAFFALAADARNCIIASTLVGTAEEKAKSESSFYDSYTRRTQSNGCILHPGFFSLLCHMMLEKVMKQFKYRTDLPIDVRELTNTLIAQAVAMMSNNVPRKI